MTCSERTRKQTRSHSGTRSHTWILLSRRFIGWSREEDRRRARGGVELGISFARAEANRTFSGSYIVDSSVQKRVGASTAVRLSMNDRTAGNRLLKLPVVWLTYPRAGQRPSASCASFLVLACLPEQLDV